MATWKKVIVSGSSAELAALKVDNLTSGSVVVGGGSAGNLSVIAINGTGTIVATTGATGLVHSGSFSGSFVGNGAGLSGVAASFPVGEKTNLTGADKFFIQNSTGSASEFVTYGNLLTDLAGTNLTVEGSDSLTLSSTISGLTSISATSFTGSLLGTASTASYVLQAVSASFATSAASATTASYVLQAVSASFATLAQTANTASYVLNAVSASQATNATSASFATLAQTANTASYVLQAVSASFATLAQTANTASYVLNAVSASYVLNAVSASYVLNAVSASQAANATSASFASNIASGLNISASSIFVSNNLSVVGTASFGYVQQITGSAVIIGEEFIILNTQSPAARFAGLQIYDSGSNATASIVWDSLNNHFVYQNVSGASYAGGGFLAGPRNTGSLGSETYPTLNRIVRGQGGDHLYDSNITDDNTAVSIAISTRVTGSLNVSAGITGSLLGTATTASYVLQAVSASFATLAQTSNTASYVLQAVSASFATLAQTANTASFVVTAQTASYVLQAVSASFATLAQTANTASFVVTAQTASYVLNAVSASNANLLDGLDSTAFAVLSSANTFTNNQVVSGTFTVNISGNTELQVLAAGIKIGNLIGDAHTVTGSLNVSGSVTATNFTGSILGTASTASYVLQAVSASFATTAASATQVANSLTAGNGLTGTTFNGSAASTFDVGAGALITVSADAVSVSTSSLIANQIPKLVGGSLSGSNISDTGTQVQITSGASSGLSIAAGGVTVTGNSTFNNNLTVAGDLTVNGTASFVNSTNLYVRDQFITINSGSSTLADSGIIVQYATGSGGPTGSAFYLEAGSTGNFGRWAVASGVAGTATAVTADEYVVTVKTGQASNPSAAPTWGGATNGDGNMWITTAGDIFIYA